MSALSVAALGVAYGAVHGVGPDHCAALASLLARDARGHTAVRTSLRFGLGHALALGGLTGAAVSAGWLIPASWERAAEIGGGILLIVLGLLAMRRSGLEVVVHRHPHQHEGGGHEHWHAHVGRNPRSHRHPHVATIIGGAFALSGVRALVLMLPATIVAGESWWTAVLFIGCFGLGVMGAMTAFGIAFRALLRLGKSERRHAERWMSVAIGLSSAVLGAWWIWTRAG
jgi:cytochrome c biogenesis protein CcdA